MTDINQNEIEIDNQKYRPKIKKLNFKFIVLIVSFLICSIIYLFCRLSSKYDPLSEMALSGINNIYFIIMNITYVITILGVIYIIFIILKKEIINLKTKETIYNVLDWFLILPVCVAISSILFSFVFTISVVSGESMMPTISEGEKLVLFFDTDFQRDDIVVIDVKKNHNFVNDEKYYVKRIIGMPGDEMKIKIEDGNTNIYINDKFYPQPYYGVNIDQSNFSIIRYCVPTDNNILITIDGKVKFVYKNSQGEKEYTDKIPENYYFVLGDNRNNSTDSRQIGLIHKDDMIGTIKYRVKGNFIFNWRKIKN